MFASPNAVRTIVVEPVKDTFELLKINMAMYCPNSILINAALNDGSSKTSLEVYGYKIMIYIY